jgi:hypothetical protein
MAPLPIFSSPLGDSGKGCPLSHFLFHIIVDALSRLICEVRSKGNFRGVKIIDQVSITHLLFVDVVLCLSQGVGRDFSTLKSILDMFCKAPGMEINHEKSSILPCNLSSSSLQRLARLLPFSCKELDSCFKYLGLFLNPNGYRYAS